MKHFCIIPVYVHVYEVPQRRNVVVAMPRVSDLTSNHSSVKVPATVNEVDAEIFGDDYGGQENRNAFCNEYLISTR